MTKPSLKILDSNFSHTLDKWGFDTCSDGLEPQLFKWDRHITQDNDLVVFTDRHLHKHIVCNVNADKKVGLILEPRVIHPWAYDIILHAEDYLDLILTFDETLLKRSDKYCKFTVGSCRFNKEEIRIHEKNKLVSIIASNKTIAPGHRLRHEVVKTFDNKIDAWGSGYKRFDNKIDALGDYFFSIAIMNEKVNNYFTEILTDVILSGTVPIFWGCDNIGDYFDKRGMFVFNDLNQLKNILNIISKEKYLEMMPYIKKNHDLALEYISTDDNVYKIIKGKLL
jgi:hypothetical protein